MERIFNNEIGVTSVSRDVSEIMKGFLILLIILGHNTIISPMFPDVDFYLRSFRTPIFFILPWLYTMKPPTCQKVIKRSGKIVFWYFIFFIVQVVFYNALFDTTFSLGETIKVFFLGGHNLLKGVTGYMYLWFMPAFLVSMFVRDLYSVASKNFRYIMIIASWGIVAFFAFHRYTDFIAIVQGAFFAALGIIASQFSLPKTDRYKILMILLFIVCSVLMFVPSIKVVIRVFMPFIAFWAIWSVVENFERYLKWLLPIGKLSMFIYLTHSLIFQFLLRVVPNSYSELTYGVIILILTIIISFIVAWCMQKIIKSIPILKDYL